jgi:hypothetical protein|tara:strand:+ start:43 stop:291 length:249 start_codon:yes stop_codon:yes gene_type:complete
MTKADSEAKKDYSNKYNKRASDIATGKSVPLPGGPVPFYYTIKALDKISRGITNLFSDDVKKPKLKKPKLDKPKIKAPKLKD